MTTDEIIAKLEGKADLVTSIDILQAAARLREQQTELKRVREELKRTKKHKGRLQQIVGRLPGYRPVDME